jgi:cell division protein FtsL
MAGSEMVSRMVGLRNAGTGVRINKHRTRKTNFRVTRKQTLLIISILLLIVVSGIVYVWSNFESTQIGYDLSHLKTMEIKLMEENRKLKLELAVFKSPQNMENIAKQKLGLRQPSHEQIIILH